MISPQHQNHDSIDNKIWITRNGEIKISDETRREANGEW